MRRLTFALGIVLIFSMAGVAQTPVVHTFTPVASTNVLVRASASAPDQAGRSRDHETIDAGGTD
jgi:hypothetical protein